MKEREWDEVESSVQEPFRQERGSQRWSWERAIKGIKYGLMFGVGLAAVSLGLSSLLTDISTDIPSVARVVAFQIGYTTGIGGLIGGFKPTSEIATNTWRSLSSLFKLKPTP